MTLKNCLHCGLEFAPCPRVPSQSYCSAEPCQRARRRLWQAIKRSNDTDYRDNQARAQKAWNQRHPEYWKRYRDTHPEYTAHNREAQLLRNGYSLVREVVRPDPPASMMKLSSGNYRLTEIKWHGIAKMDVIKVITISHYAKEVAQR
ncbi:hypothetical protein [Undibacterium sp.]|jgi:hypothetical protein|uniref:hypothetical protein n=1 Tax=Undibacterium sp. TaxID=1914977 RepID=UPI002BD4574F|nr:hypothetical protein [Undibacterium sp.]HTD02729.1 hypothetical protein [Undibacterium sp.]